MSQVCKYKYGSCQQSNSNRLAEVTSHIYKDELCGMSPGAPTFKPERVARKAGGDIERVVSQKTSSKRMPCPTVSNADEKLSLRNAER